MGTRQSAYTCDNWHACWRAGKALFACSLGASRATNCIFPLLAACSCGSDRHTARHAPFGKGWPREQRQQPRTAATGRAQRLCQRVPQPAQVSCKGGIPLFELAGSKPLGLSCCRMLGREMQSLPVWNLS